MQMEIRKFKSNIRECKLKIKEMLNTNIEIPQNCGRLRRANTIHFFCKLPEYPKFSRLRRGVAEFGPRYADFQFTMPLP